MKTNKNFRTLLTPLTFAALLWLAACANVPAPETGHYNRGVALYDDGKLAGAIDEYKLALRQNPKDTFAKYNLAVAYQDREKYGEAMRLYREILSTTEDARSRINIAAIHYAEGAEDKAIEELRTAVKKNSDDPNPASVLGEYLERKSELKEARSYYDQALARDAKHAPTYFRSGRLHLKQNHRRKGMEHLYKAVDLGDPKPEYLEALGAELAAQDKTARAIHMYERASTLEPDRADIFTRLGDLYKKDHYYKKAVARYWTAISIQDDNPAVHRHLKEIFENLLDAEEDWLKHSKEKGAIAKAQ